MASLRITSSAARLLRSAPSRILPAARRFESSSSLPAKKEDQSSATPALQRDAPDYSVPVDKATSNFTPVPKDVQDGSEEGILSAAVISGAPMELQARTVRIYKPAKPATQSGDHIGSRWRMDWDVLGKGHRWENPLMGWQSSADFMQGTHIHFKTKEDAIAFAEKQGYEYFVQEPNERHFTPKAYANNFLYSPGKLKHIRTK
ncbi:ETC complex I subunit conserved region-domain-containing protein [Echria macrotheca]|uniref:NADH dehydrogenase [ubiquinone] iron-sulfur protein 4, mitochondrial n=1 Tax=Echria macrotheca TaxID=438768 RepID=A0AAJ0F646_9PEZI|nr:ETC complex I subunit conserved region-domain-containing protein [Echria macrotheca]